MALYRRDVLAVGVPRLNAGALQVKHSNIQSNMEMWKC